MVAQGLGVGCPKGNLRIIRDPVGHFNPRKIRYSGLYITALEFRVDHREYKRTLLILTDRLTWEGKGIRMFGGNNRDANVYVRQQVQPVVAHGESHFANVPGAAQL